MITIDIVVTTYPLLELGANDHARAFGRRTTRKQHDPRPGLRERCLEQPNRHAHCDASASVRALVICHWPRIALQLFQNPRELVLARRHGHEEAASGIGRYWLARWNDWPVLYGVEVEHLLDSL
jgi:hypothetical protein